MPAKLQTQPAETSIEREPLRWLFTAEFADGSTLHQTADDQSIHHDPNAAKNPSAFSDVLERSKQTKLVAFHLYSNYAGYQQAASVDLVTGAFIVNDVPFHAHDQYFEPTEHELELIYFRETKADFNMEQRLTRHYVSRYFIGWQAKNSKHKATIAVG